MDIISNVKDFFYKHKDTRFHNLHPAIKLLSSLVIIILAMLIEDPLILLILFLATALIVAEAKIARGWWFYIKIALWISVFLIPLNLILSQSGETILFYAELNIPFFETLTITLESLLFGLVMALRLTVVISAFAVMALTISPEEMMWLMAKMKIPTKSVFMTSLSTRFVPALLDDVETLEQVQKARGAKLKGIRGKAPIVIPLLSNSLERSVTVAEALEARGFTGKYDRD